MALVNWVKNFNYLYTWIICSSEILQTISQVDSSFDKLAIFKRNLSYNLLISFIKTSQNRESLLIVNFSSHLSLMANTELISVSMDSTEDLTAINVL